jgi:hypothetical protein
VDDGEWPEEMESQLAKSNRVADRTPPILSSLYHSIPFFVFHIFIWVPWPKCIAERRLIAFF